MRGLRDVRLAPPRVAPSTAIGAWNMNIIFPTVTIIIARNLKSIKNIRNTSQKNTTSTITMMMTID